MANRRKRAGSRPALGKRVKSAAPASDNSMAGGFELAEIRRLIRLVQRTGIGELEVSTGGRTGRIAACSGAPQAMRPVADAGRPAAAAEAATGGGSRTAESIKNENLLAVASP